MAKKKIEEPENLDFMTGKIKKDLGNSFILASEIKQKRKNIIPVSPCLDIGLCGGIPMGSWVRISGPPKKGKSVLALQICKNAYDLYQCPIFYLNIEGRFKGQSIRSVEGLDLDKIVVIESSEDKILDGEDYLNLAEEIIMNVPNAIIVMDSVSRLYPKKAREEDTSSDKRSTIPKLLSDFCSRMSGVVPVKNCVVIAIAQQYANSAPKGPNAPSKVTGGGNSIYFQGDVLMDIKYTEDVKERVDGEERVVGHAVHWDIEQNAIGAPPTGLVTSYTRFGVGIDKYREIASLGVDFGLIEKAGAWYNIEDKKFQGEANLIKFLSENKELADSINKNIREMSLDMDILSMYNMP